MNPDAQFLDRFRPLLLLHVRQLRLGRLRCAAFDSSDAVHETFVKALRGLDKYRGQTDAELVGWLRAILRNVLIDYARAASVRNIEVSLDMADEGDTPLGAYLTSAAPGPSTLASRKEDILRVTTAVAQLPDDQQDAVAARFVLGLPVAEVAARMGRTEKSAALLLYRAKVRLRELLGEGEA